MNESGTYSHRSFPALCLELDIVALVVGSLDLLTFTRLSGLLLPMMRWGSSYCTYTSSASAKTSGAP